MSVASDSTPMPNEESLGDDSPREESFREVRDADDLLEAVASAAGNRTRLDVQGLGSRKTLGRPVDSDQVLSLAPLSGITNYEPDELVLMAKAATPLKDIVKTLDKAGQMLGFDPKLGAIKPEQALGTIGGVIATNSSGPRRVQAGAVRDHLLGFGAVSGRGEVFQSGGRVVKNVTGYDLSKLMAGSFGTLGVMHDVIIKTVPKPEDGASLIIAPSSIDEASQAIRASFASSHEPIAAAIIPKQAAVFSSHEPLKNMAERHLLAVIRVDGFAVSVKSRMAALSDMLFAYGDQHILSAKDSDLIQAELRENLLLPKQDNRVLWKVSCPPASGGEILKAILNRPHCCAYADWGGALIWATHPLGGDSGVGFFRGIAESHGGAATLVEAPEDTRRNLEVFPPLSPALAALSSRVKAGFDPMGILNPGRLYEGL